jgi:small subunit ribosomal protein S8e
MARNILKRRYTGAKPKPFRGRRKHEMDRPPVLTRLGPLQVVKRRVRGGSFKLGLRSADFANVYDPSSNAVKKAKVLRVLENPAGGDIARMGVITKGAIIETELGRARVTSRPSQNGVLNAVLLPEKRA